MSRFLLRWVSAFVMLGLVACGGSGASGNTIDITVTATEFKFEPAVITVASGQAVNFTLKNQGSIDHNWMFQAIGFKITAVPGKSATRSFVAPTAPGTYDITCDVAGHSDAGMTGKLIVK